MPAHPWKKRVLVAAGIAAAALAVFTAIATRDDITANNLVAGDCFAMPDDEEFLRVKRQSCTEPHESEMYAEVRADNNTLAESACDDELLLAVPISRLAELPDDTVITQFADLTRGSTSYSCVIHSPSGALIGSVLD